MTIKTECVIKHVKHDYKELGIIVAAAAVGIAICVGTVAILSAGVVTGYIGLNICVALIVLAFTAGFAVILDASDFEVIERDGTVRKVDSGLFITMAIVVAMIPYGLYLVVGSASSPQWESPTVSFLVFVALILVGTPIGCAIARCKE